MTTPDEPKPLTDEVGRAASAPAEPASPATEAVDIEAAHVDPAEPVDPGEPVRAADVPVPADAAGATGPVASAPGATPNQSAESTGTAETAEPAREQAPAETVQSAPRRRPALRTVLRWTTATVLCLGLGTGTAFAVMAPKRTDIPGLQTPSDGRYTYPALELPELPVGASGPGESGASRGAPGGTVPHAVSDIRLLLLPAAVGGKPDPTLPGHKGWVATSGYAGLFTNPGPVTQLLRENGARQVAATGWTMPDGTHIAIYLVPFLNGTEADTVVESQVGDAHLVRAPDAAFDRSDAGPVTGSARDLAVSAKDGKPAVRASLFTVDEIAGLLVVTNPKAVSQVDFEQALTLQSELLGG